MKRPSGNTFALLGLFVGLTVGLGVIIFKQWLVHEIIDSLEDEVQAACDCSLAFDKFSLSFSTLGGRAKNVRILEKGVPKLSFREIKAKVDLGEIRDKRVHLSTLTLSDGTADGVGPDSATFRFIDQLTTPLPPEKQKKDRWRVILDTLEVKDSFLRESFKSSEISASGVSLLVKRIDQTFSLTPRIQDLRYTSFGKAPGDPPTEIFLGPLSASLLIDNAQTVFNSLTLGRDSSHIDIQAILDSDHGNELSGSAQYSMTPDYIGLPDWLRGSFIGSSSISGPIGSPILAGSVEHSSTDPLTLAFPHASILPMKTMTGSLLVDLNHGSPIVSLKDLHGTGEGVSLKAIQPLVFSDKGLSSGFDVSVPKFSYGPFSIQQGKARIIVSQGATGVNTSFDVTALNLELQGIPLGPTRLNIKLTPENVVIAADSLHATQGALHWKGVIDLTTPEPTLTTGRLTLESFRYPSSVPVSDTELAPIAITTNFSLKGPLDLGKLLGEGDTTLSFPASTSGLPLHGKTTLKDGILKVALPRSQYQASADLTIDFVTLLSGKLHVSLPLQKASTFFSDEDCGQIGGSFSYSFPLANTLRGSGELAIDAFSVGCSPYQFVLPKNTKIPIRHGNLNINNLAISTLDSIMTINGVTGVTDGINISAKGTLQLSSLIPLLPAIDDLKGLLKADLAFTGPLSAPQFSGSANLSNGEFGISSPDVGAHDVQGVFRLSGNRVRIEKLTGSVNNGAFSVQGSLLPFDWLHSELTSSLKEVTIEPMSDTSITFSGDLRLGLGKTKRQMLAGDVQINFAEVAKDFDLNKILINAISGYFLPSRLQPATSKKTVDIDVDVGISAPRNIFVLTPFFSAEMNALLRTSGTISRPSLIGSMQILSGWVGLKGNRFDITSGGLAFKPGNIVPTIELVSEGTLRAPSGDNVLIILAASGPLQNPKIELSSDRGLSQGELLLLITSSRQLGGRTEANRLGSQLNKDQRYFMSQDSFSSFQSFLQNLAKIDTLSFEPSYNQFTGTIEPAVIAKKNVTPRLSLAGESLFSSVSNSRVGGVYNLSPKLDVNAFFQTVSTQQNSIISSDLTYTVLSEQSEFMTFTIEGLDKFDRESILASARLGPTSRIINNTEGLASIGRQVENYMHDQGYRQASISISCPRGERYCYELLISVSEDSPSKVHEVVFDGDALPEDLQQVIRDIAPANTLATSTVVDTIERRIVLALRNDGYISARITPRYREIEGSSDVTLVVSADIREPISFVFLGNKVFTAKDFLDSIDLFSRKRAFGNNTIKLLVQNIEQMYQEQGYLFVQVSYTEDRSDPTRVVYTITIAEEAPTRVRTVSLVGNNHLPLVKIVPLMRELGLAEQIELLHPIYAIPHQLDSLRDALVAVYQEEGFPQSSVSYQIKPTESAKLLDVEYMIIEGDPRRMNTISIGGYPLDLISPALPSTPISIPRVNSFIANMIETLKGEGYLFPSITAAPDADDKGLVLTVESGERTIVTSISYEGLARIPEESARKNTALRVGAPYRQEEVNLTRRDLLRSGLFARTEILAQDGAFDSPHEAITIRLVERPLETLEIGAGANSEFGLHTFGEAVNKSFFADGRTLSLRVDTYFDQALINPTGSGLISQGFTSARYMDPSFMGSNYTLTEEARYQRQELSTQEFNLDRFLIGSYFFRQYESNLTLSAGHSMLWDNLQDVNPGAIISDLDFGTVRLSFLSSIMKLDKRDNSLLPHSGYTFSLEPKLSMEALGSQANFGSLVTRGTTIVPLDALSPRYSLGLGLNGGVSQPWGDTTEIPITQRFYLGGRTTVRGFRENSLGPRGDDGAIIGGDTMLAGNTQFQYLVTDALSTHTFFDFGNVFLRHQEFELSDIRTSIGLGFQYLSPIGPVGFDIGHPLKELGGEPSVRIHFSVGSMF